MSRTYARDLGVRLRAVRTAQGLSLNDVEKKSRGRLKAVVVGSYERADRALTVDKLAEIARFYDVPPDHLLPAGRRATAAHEAAAAFVGQIAEVIAALPEKEFGYIASRVAAAIKGRIEDEAATHYEHQLEALRETIHGLRAQLAALTPLEVSA